MWLYVCKQKVSLVKALNDGADVISQLLHSNTASDVENAIRFFERADAFRMPIAKNGYQKMLPIVMDKDNPKLVEAVLQAYHTRFFAGEDTTKGCEDTLALSVSKKLCE